MQWCNDPVTHRDTEEEGVPWQLLHSIMKQWKLGKQIEIESQQRLG